MTIPTPESAFWRSTSEQRPFTGTPVAPKSLFVGNSSSMCRAKAGQAASVASGEAG